MKVYAIVYDYQGYESCPTYLFASKADAIKYLKEELLDSSEESVVEWELDTQEQKQVYQGKNNG